MKRNTDFMLRDIAGEVILVPTGAATQQFNGMITLNEVAAFIWKNLDESKSKEELVDKIMDEFEVDEETARTDIFLGPTGVGKTELAKAQNGKGQYQGHKHRL